ncbi:MAG TPA: antibiotic biosynthesis monooxygenase [Myxococcaceae bacterium]|nr:antibiotic biosynthesis monooxygenase [Myxococcaceae bacterium]
MLTFDEAVPVTVVVTRRVRPDLAPAFEAWLHGVAADAMRFEGHLGVHVIRPEPAASEYTAVFRFRTPAELRAWMESDLRARHFEEAERFWDGAGREERVSGLETWFTLPGQPAIRPPPRYKIAVVSFFAVYGLLLVVPPVLAPWATDLPPPVQMALTSAVMIALMTYGIMPMLTRLLSRWLYAAR